MFELIAYGCGLGGFMFAIVVFIHKAINHNRKG